jgi:hypothetical protein
MLLENIRETWLGSVSRLTTALAFVWWAPLDGAGLMRALGLSPAESLRQHVPSRAIPARLGSSADA